jgi:hypothetical protein
MMLLIAAAAVAARECHRHHHPPAAMVLYNDRRTSTTPNGGDHFCIKTNDAATRTRSSQSDEGHFSFPSLRFSPMMKSSPLRDDGDAMMVITMKMCGLDLWEIFKNSSVKTVG